MANFRQVTLCLLLASSCAEDFQFFSAEMLPVIPSKPIHLLWTVLIHLKITSAIVFFLSVKVSHF